MTPQTGSDFTADEWRQIEISNGARELKRRLAEIERRLDALERKKVACGACGGARVIKTGPPDYEEYNCSACDGRGVV